LLVMLVPWSREKCWMYEFGGSATDRRPVIWFSCTPEVCVVVADGEIVMKMEE